MKDPRAILFCVFTMIVLVVVWTHDKEPADENMTDGIPIVNPATVVVKQSESQATTKAEKSKLAPLQIKVLTDWINDGYGSYRLIELNGARFVECSGAVQPLVRFSESSQPQ